VTLALLLLLPARAEAYPWMIRHHYSGCTTCHADPSGAGPLTAYGQVIEGSVLPSGTEAGAEPATGFLFGLVRTPEWLSLGADVRALWLRAKVPGARLSDELIFMQADAEAAVSVDRLRASASLGYAAQGALGAALTRGVEHNLVSRQHWLGYALSEGTLLRAGRMNLPFGIRTIEHNLWARDLTRTSINDDQQYGLALAATSTHWRGEVMAIVGNFQLRPDDYRERGYSAFIEFNPHESLGLGASSLITHRQRDTRNLQETWRHTHGVFGRWATGWEPLVLQTEWDYVFVSSRDEFYRRGPVSFLQADLEPTQGVHFLATAEANKVGSLRRFWGYGGWLSYWWFFAPHADVRLDAMYQSLGSVGGRYGVYTLLLQGHLSL
jgi:hypothetical protein